VAKETSGGGTVRTKLAALACALAALGLGVWLAPEIGEGLRSSTWPSVRGTLLTAARKWWLERTPSGSRSESQWLELHYAYSVVGDDGRLEHYTGGAFDVSTPTSGAPKHSLSIATKAMATHAMRDAPSLTVYYDPADPSRAVIATGIPFGTAMLLLPGAALLAAAWMLFRGENTGARQLAYVVSSPPARFAPRLAGASMRTTPIDHLVEADTKAVVNLIARLRPSPNTVREPPAWTDPKHSAADPAGFVILFLLGGVMFAATLVVLYRHYACRVPPSAWLLAYEVFALTAVALPSWRWSPTNARLALAFCLALPAASLWAFVVWVGDRSRDVRYVAGDSVIVQQLDDAHPAIAAHAGWIVRDRRGPVAAIDALGRCLDSPAPWVRRAAIAAIESIDGPAARLMPRLADLARTDPDPQCRTFAAQALRRIGD
jgi:hypothetical protein